MCMRNRCNSWLLHLVDYQWQILIWMLELVGRVHNVAFCRSTRPDLWIRFATANYVLSWQHTSGLIH
jgi:hypothetical protein